MNLIKDLGTFRLFVILSLTIFANCAGAQDQELPDDLTEIGIKELMSFDLVVTSPGKKDQTVANVSSAIFVLTQDDIRRSGASNIPEALRLVPGVNVARVSASQWAVSVRGFNQVYAHKLLVLVDGVSVFSPLTNGIYWETIDLLMEDIDRIEVIRGPGAALWGSNAVNGVVNIITKRAKDTKGGVATIGGGMPDRSLGSIRVGGKIGESSSGRISAKYSDMGDNRLVTGGNANDLWRIGSLDARVDSELDKGESLTFRGHGFSEADQVQTQTPILTPPFVDSESFSGRGKWEGGFASVNYHNEFSPTSILNVIGSGSSQHRTSRLISLRYQVYDLDISHQYELLPNHDLVYGGSVRTFRNASNGSDGQRLTPEDRTMNRANWFFQDEIALEKDIWHVVVGSKFENNTSTGFEYMPNARLIWTPNTTSSVWTAVSRAVAPPALVFEDVRFPVATIPGGPDEPPTSIEIFGDRGVKSEEVISYEAGYRAHIGKSTSFDLSAFYNRYNNILTEEPDTPFVETRGADGAPVVVVPLRFRNMYTARTLGGEASLQWHPYDWCKLDLGYAYLSGRGNSGQSQESDVGTFVSGSAPRHTVLARTSIDLGNDLTLGLSGRYIDSLKLGDISDYFELDSNLDWRLNKDISLQIYGENLLDSAHQEYIGNLFGPAPTEMRRAGYVVLKLRF